MAVGLAAGSVIAGCGSSDGGGEPGAVKATLKSYVGAVLDGDGDKACSYFTDAMKQRTYLDIRSAAPEVRSCGDALTRASRDLTATDKDAIRDFGGFTTRVSGAHATVRIARTGRVTTLIRAAGRWLIDSEKPK